MNEDTTDKVFKVILITIFVCFLIAIPFLFISINNGNKALEKSCVDIGLELKQSWDNKVYCAEGNDYFYTTFKCKGIINIECQATLISIGNVRVANK